MRNMGVWWLVSLVITALAVHVATIKFGTFDFSSPKEELGDEKNVIVIVALADEEMDGKVNEDYFRHHVFGENKGDAWKHAKAGSFLGHTGFMFSKKPVPILIQPILPLW